ncbi:choice-of-anchor X domain-containing protein [Vibrio sp. 10N.222.52.C3]|uniref:choice-of-anchor X domain-containing protein n=1 Tax=Vibrio sp. 10N.222.52.C3 TaxID=3229631 RepID=UPI00354C6855
MKFIKQLVMVFSLFCTFITPAIASNAIPVGMSTSTTLSQPVTSNDNEVTMLFTIDKAEALKAEIIVPLDDATVYLVKPNGQVATSSNDVQANILSGDTQSPPLPGSYLFLPEVTNPEPGEWKIVVDFPNPSYNTVIIAQVAIQSPIAFGMAIAANQFVVGEPVPVSALLTNKGNPITGAQTSAVIIDEAGIKTRLTLKDEGVNFDAIAKDGVYSNIFVPPAEGDYLIEGITSFEEYGTTITRQTSKKIHVLPSDIEFVSLSLAPLFSSEGCVIALEQRLELDVKSAGDFAIHGYLTDGIDELNTSKRLQLKPAKQIVTLQYSTEDIFGAFDSASTLTSNPTIIYAITQDDIRISAPRIQFEEFIDLASFERCREPIEVTGSLVTTPTMSQDGTYIDSLSFEFPIHVTRSGTYTGSVNIVGAAGEYLELVSFQEPLEAAENTIKFTVPGDTFKQADGPYELNALLIYSGVDSYRQGVLGQTPPYQASDFSPPVNVTLPSNLFGLERENWQATPATQVTQHRVGGYLRAGASIPYDYETLASFDLSEVRGKIKQATLIVDFGDSTLQFPFNNVTAHIVNQTWSPNTLDYDTFCESFTICAAWSNPLTTFNNVEAGQTLRFTNSKLLEALNEKRVSGLNKLDIALTSSPYERSFFINVKQVSLFIEY